ncbi:hypothetical protein B14911_01785 [Bacillus sp. NRRL B-14911]|jgi:hypothetical protein|nr:hypothetical protein B14911_01785 [Bacillus sp. NRRL B-14911]
MKNSHASFFWKGMDLSFARQISIIVGGLSNFMKTRNSLIKIDFTVFEIDAEIKVEE